MPTTTAERADLLETLNAHRSFLRQTTQGLTDAQAAATPTVSALSIGGIIKHVSATEAAWASSYARTARLQHSGGRGNASRRVRDV